ncbi:CRTAC1 family protein [Planctomyces sp. SH-PL62]|uniref:CRTAC1 family protein n=1 Tax=Planctomyces sp. SH-PL62 TaxID=1636152 RepID=UPI00078D101A|nr:CRTAC1 family protein [Planctomyces sp. SH-PL62]AMV36632.1 ASPIC and UnbV [Planctomyces sp. SH-PL62]
MTRLRAAIALATFHATAFFAVAQDFRFEDVAARSGVVFQFDSGSRGRHDLPEIMGGGVALFDADGDGLLDLYLCNGGPIAADPPAEDPPSRLFLNRGGGRFVDWTEAAGAPGPSYAMGAAAGDFDADGRVDLLQTNGHVLDRDRLGIPFAMPPILLKGRDGGFQDVSARAGPWFARLALGRSLAVGDVDGDGRLDVAATALDAPFALLLNRSAGPPLVSVDLVDRRGLPAVGARARARIRGREIVQDLVAGGSYLSSSPPRLAFGLGDAAQIDELEVAWPWGGVESWRGLRPGKPARLIEGDSPTVPLTTTGISGPVP